MLVCPNCRNENQEGARFCQVCGRALDPVHSPMRGTRDRDRPVEELDIQQPKRSSALPVILIGVVLVAAAVIGGIWYSARPNPCEGKFSSALFGYCAEIPEGWEGASQVETPENVDEFTPPEDDAVTWVRVREIIDPATQTAQYAQQFRTGQEARGLEPSRVEVVSLDGEQALAWEVSLPTEGGESIRAREVVIVREDGAWRISLYATPDSYSNARVGFEQLLSTWTWK